MRLGISAHARENPAKTAIVWGDRRVTFADLDTAANRVARALRAAGVGVGDRIGVALRNRPEVFEILTAAARLQAQVVPIAWRSKAEEVRYVAEDSAIRLLVAEPDARAATEGLPTWYLDAEYLDARDAAPADPLPDAPDPAAPFIRFYTSGTTGRPKAVERARPSPDAYLRTLVRSLELFEVEQPEEVHLCCGPLYHSAPLTFSSYGLLCGQTVVLMERFDAEPLLRAIERERVTWTFLVPIHFVRILALPPDARARHDASSMRRLLHAAAPCPPAVKRAIMDLFPGDVVWEFYGMTEGRATMISAEEWRRKPGSVGRAMPGVEVAILDAGGRALPPGETGLIYVRPLDGSRFWYAGAPRQTEAAWAGDAFTVGDMGYLDADGYLFLTDRSQDMIITGGANVYPAEVEAVLYRHPAVGDVAVIGVPDDEWGESVTAIVQAHAPVEPGELVAFCREHLAHYKCPRRVEIVQALPRDATGKIRKRDLREPYWAGRARRI